MKDLFSADLKAAHPFFMKEPFLPEGETTANSNDGGLRVITYTLLQRHNISLRNYDDDGFTNDINLKEGVLTMNALNRWTHAEFYYVQLLINISSFRRAQIDETKYYDRTVHERVTDAVVAYQLLDYFRLITPMHRISIANHFHEGGAHYYTEEASEGQGGSLQLEVDQQLNLILNHKGTYINYHYYSNSDFTRDFKPYKPYLMERASSEEESVDSYCKSFKKNIYLP